MERVFVTTNTEREGHRLEAILGIGQRSASRSRLGENSKIAQSAGMRYVHRGKIITEFLFILKRVEPRINSSLKEAIICGFYLKKVTIQPCKSQTCQQAVIRNKLLLSITFG